MVIQVTTPAENSMYSVSNGRKDALLFAIDASSEPNQDFIHNVQSCIAVKTESPREGSGQQTNFFNQNCTTSIRH